jgi:hypothetical protein
MMKLLRILYVPLALVGIVLVFEGIPYVLAYVVMHSGLLHSGIPVILLAAAGGVLFVAGEMLILALVPRAAAKMREAAERRKPR